MLYQEIVLLLFLFMVFMSSCGSDNKSIEAPNTVINRDSLISTYQLQKGDIVLRKGNSIESEAVSLVDGNGKYSHIGIIMIQNDTPFVIHIVPDSLSSTVDYCLKQKLSTFFSVNNARYGCVLRLKNKDRKLTDSASFHAMEFYRNKVTFDGAYDINTDDKMYCTELVWKAYRINNFDIIDGKISNVNLPFLSNKAILPSTFLYSPYLENIYYF